MNEIFLKKALSEERKLDCLENSPPEWVENVAVEIDKTRTRIVKLSEALRILNEINCEYLKNLDEQIEEVKRNDTFPLVLHD